MMFVRGQERFLTVHTRYITQCPPRSIKRLELQEGSVPISFAEEHDGRNNDCLKLSRW
jgi:hypothetical protein